MSYIACHEIKQEQEDALNFINRRQDEIERLMGELAADKNDACKWISVKERLPEPPKAGDASG